MVSRSKAAANRANSQLSTGPKSIQGKIAASRNAMKHGLLSRQVVLPDEDQSEFDELRDRLLGDLEPVGELEIVFAERIVMATWRLRRVVRLEAAVIRSEQLERDRTASPILDALLEAESGRGPLPEPGPEYHVYMAMVRDSNGTNQLERLRRYEVTIERSLFSAVHELERLQRRRRGEVTDEPKVIDLTIRDEKA